MDVQRLEIRTPRAALHHILLYAYPGVPADPRDVRHHPEPIDAVNDRIALPPQARTTMRADFVAPFPMSVAMVSTHQHRFGTYASVRPVVDGIESAVAYENRRWSEPGLRWLDPPIRLAMGDRLRVQCEWHNRSDVTVRYGPSSAT